MRRRSFYRRRHEAPISETTQFGIEGDEEQSGSPAKQEDRGNETAHVEVRKERVLKACRKCGKLLNRGMYFHERYCKGDPTRS